MLLALETSTGVCSVAFKDDEGKYFEKRIEKRGGHSEKLFLFIDELMEEHDFSIRQLDAVLISAGPGSYTGLRISASAAKGLLFQTGIPLYAFNSLAGFARSALNECPDAKIVHTIIDARRVHLYHQKFRNHEGLLRAETGVEVLPINAVEKIILEDDIIIGTGLGRISAEALVKAVVFDKKYITARSLISLYEEEYYSFFKKVDPEKFAPQYYTSYQAENREE